MTNLRRMITFCLLLTLCLSFLCACEQELPETSSSTEAAVAHVTAPVPYTELGITELMRMMCYCPCNTMSTVSDKSQMSCLYDVMELGEMCPIVNEFLNRPDPVKKLAEHGWEIYQHFKASDDLNVMNNARGFGQLMRLLCPDEFLESAKEDRENRQTNGE